MANARAQLLRFPDERAFELDRLGLPSLAHPSA